MGDLLRLLLVEDSLPDAALTVRVLERAGFAVRSTRVDDPIELRHALTTGSWDLAITDHNLPLLDSTAVIALIRSVVPDLGCIIVSGELGERAAIAGMHAGADDYVLKDRLDGLPGAVERTLRLARERSERHRLTREIQRRTSELQTLVGSVPMGVVTVDARGRIRDANRFAETLLRWPNGLSGRHLTDLIVPQDHPRAFATFTQLLNGVVEPAQEWGARIGDGSERPVEVTTALLDDPSSETRVIAIIRDVAESRALSLELARSEAYLRSLVTSIPEGIVTLGSDGVILSCNAAAMELLHLDGSCVGRPFTDFVAPGDRDTAWARIVDRTAEVEGHPQDVRLVRADGHLLEVEISAARWEGGRQGGGILALIRDAGERNALIRQLRLQEERFGLVTKATTDGVYDWEEATGRIWWNEAAADLFGEPPPETGGFAWWTLRLHPGDRERVLRSLEEAMQAGLPNWRSEYRLRHADGSWRHIVDRGLFILDGHGRVQRMIGAMADISDRHIAEQEQERLRAALAAALTDWTATFDSVMSMVVLVDRDLRIRRLNHQARRSLSRSYAELVGLPLDTIEAPPWPAVLALATRTLQGESAVDHLVKDEASGRFWNVMTALIPRPDQPTAVLFIHESTELIRMRERLEQERAMSRLGSLVAGVAHEVRNPLFGISATVDAFEARYGVRPEFVRFAESLRTEVDRLSRLMRDLLEYGRPPKLQMVADDLAPILASVATQALPQAALRGVEIVTEGGSAPCRFVFDGERLHQVLQNLVANALAHTPTGSAIRILVEPGVPEPDDTRWVRISVEDEGPGFREADLPHVFEPFFSKRRGGIGLGLSLVESFVRQHGGRVVAGNRAEGGARVVVSLPMGDA